MSEKAYERIAWAMVILTINAASVMWAYGLGLERMTRAADNALGAGQYATVLLKQCTMTAERALNAVYAEDAMLSQRITNLPPIRLSDAVTEVAK